MCPILSYQNIATLTPVYNHSLRDSSSLLRTPISDTSLPEVSKAESSA